ncbi:unnamed protein product [Periconia digitata]|uniref:Transposase n=1 Tax=Periconia digitata TaxID=1303443 RepID=A0A9W4XD00_9PLEO|nr:unnamed protein product [Periconia digitata]
MGLADSCYTSINYLKERVGERVCVYACVRKYGVGVNKKMGGWMGERTSAYVHVRTRGQYPCFCVIRGPSFFPSHASVRAYVRALSCY